jgi:hypothetical protein
MRWKDGQYFHKSAQVRKTGERNPLSRSHWREGKEVKICYTLPNLNPTCKLELL